jgi:tetratricopeptide (TPR) repeat protein
MYHQRGRLFHVYDLPEGLFFDHSERYREAEKCYRKAIDVGEQLVAGHSEAPRYTETVANAYNNLGLLLDWVRRLSEAEEAFGRAIDLQEGVLQDQQFSSDLRHRLAGTYTNLAKVLGAQDRSGEAEESCRKALALRQRNVREYPDVPMFRDGLAMTLGTWGQLLSDDRRLSEARGVLEEAVAHHQEALQAEPDNPIYQRSLCSQYQWLINTLLSLRDHAEAAKIAVSYAQVYDTPSPHCFTAVLALVQCARAARADEALSSDERETLARSYLDRAKEMLEGAITYAEAPTDRMFLAWFLAQPPEPELRDAARALKIAEEAFDQLPDSWSSWFQLAVIHYRAGNWEESLRAINEAHDRKSEGTCTSWSLAAMAHWQLGHKEEARAWYSKTVVRMEQTGCRNPEHHRFAREAAELLGLAPPQVSGQNAARDESPDPPLTDLPAFKTSPFQKQEPPEPLP